MALGRARQVDLETLLPQLADDIRVRDAMTASLPAIAEQFVLWAKTGEVQAVIESGAYDLISDLIHDESAAVEEITGLGGDGPFPITVLQFGPAFWVSAQEFDPICYFRSRQEASRTAREEFEPFISEYEAAVAERDAEPDEEDDGDGASVESSSQALCPFCESEESCAHHLLNVDLVFRDAGGGALYDKFSERWSNIIDVEQEQRGGDFDERQAFDELLDAVAALADAEVEFEFEAGPGQSTTYRNYYCSSAGRAAAAVASFGSAPTS